MSTLPLPGVSGLTHGFPGGASADGRFGFLARIENWFRRATLGSREEQRFTPRANDWNEIVAALEAVPLHERAAESSEASAEEAAEESPLEFTHEPLSLRESLTDAAEDGTNRDLESREVPDPDAFPRLAVDDTRPSALHGLRDGVAELAGLMAGVRDGLERQASGQEELLRCLSQLPQVLSQFPESGRLQGEALRQQGEAMRAVCDQVGRQSDALHRQGEQQERVADVLERIRRAECEQGRVLDALCRHESAFGESLGRVGEAMRAVGAGSEAGARVLEQLRDGIHARDGELERAFKSHNARVTTLLCVAIGTSVAALASVAAAGFLLLSHGGLR